MVEISIDLETLDLIPTSYILSIGAVAFDINTGVTLSEFYAVIGFNDDTQENRTKSKKVIEWWAKQSPQAITEIHDKINCIDLQEGLIQLSGWIHGVTPGEVTVWGNGATFDISILENAYNNSPPWSYYNIGDMRTILRHAKAKGYTKPEFKGVKHSAHHDAKNQAKIIYEAWNYETA